LFPTRVAVPQSTNLHIRDTSSCSIDLLVGCSTDLLVGCSTDLLVHARVLFNK